MLCCLFPLVATAQLRNTPLDSSLKEGNIFVNVGYFAGLADELNSTSFPPVGGGVDYAVTPNYIVGVEYAQTKDGADFVRLVGVRMGTAMVIKPTFHLYSIASIGLKRSEVDALKTKKSLYGAYFGARVMPMPKIPVGVFAELGYSEAVYLKGGISFKVN